MRRYDDWRLWVLALVVCQLAVAPSHAQTNGQMGAGQMGGSHGKRGSANQHEQAPAPSITIRPEPWPRLDRGAVLCGSEDALKHYQEGVAEASGAGTPAPPLPEDCARVTDRLPIRVLHRDGPGRTQVESSAPPARTGWTDTWLPDNPPTP